jgi:hypothetical protein
LIAHYTSHLADVIFLAPRQRDDPTKNARNVECSDTKLSVVEAKRTTTSATIKENQNKNQNG